MFHVLNFGRVCDTRSQWPKSFSLMQNKLSFFFVFPQQTCKGKTFTVSFLLRLQHISGNSREIRVDGIKRCYSNSFVRQLINSAILLYHRELPRVFHDPLLHIRSWHAKLSRSPWPALCLVSLAIGHSIQRSRVGYSGFLYGSSTDGEQTVPERQSRSGKRHRD